MESAHVIATDDSTADEACFLEDADVLGRRGEGHSQRGGKLAEIAFAVGKLPEHRAAGGVGQGVKDTVEGWGFILNHLV